MFNPDLFFLENDQRIPLISLIRDSKSIEMDYIENDYKVDDNEYQLKAFAEEEGQKEQNSELDNNDNCQDFKALDMVLDESKDPDEQELFDKDPWDGKPTEGKLKEEISTKEQTPNQEIKVKDFQCE